MPLEGQRESLNTCFRRYLQYLQYDIEWEEEEEEEEEEEREKEREREREKEEERSRRSVRCWVYLP